MSRSPSGNDGAESIALAVVDASQVGEARRAAAAFAQQVGFGTTEAGKLALVVTEAANNLVKHGGGGELVLRSLERGGICGIEILALDRGPGMADLGRCLRDGYSTAGTPGTGLGAIVRTSSTFDIHSTCPGGTALLARLWSGPSSPADPRTGLEVGAVSVPYPGESVCGDAWTVEQFPSQSFILVADGLGHGLLAATAAKEAVRVFRENLPLAPAELLRAIDPALRATRGAAVLVTEVNLATRQVICAGVGNISGAVFSNGMGRSLVSHNGTVGHAVCKIQEFTYPFPSGALLILHSDGLATRWHLDLPGLSGRTPALIAGVLYRDFKRGRDDVTVVVARESIQETA